MDRVHDYESCDIGSIPSMGVYFGVITLTGKGVVLKTTSNRSDTA